MKEWLPTQELAGLPGMPDTEQGVRYKAKKNLWQWRAKACGKGCEYSLYDLPKITKSYLAQSGLLLGNCAESTQADKPLSVNDDTATSSGGFSGVAMPCGSLLPVCDEPGLSGSTTTLPVVDPSFSDGNLEIKVGMVVSNVQDKNRDARAEEAARRLRIIMPILKMPERFPGRRAMLESVAKTNNTTAATLYRWITDYKNGGLAAMADKPRADLGQARVLVSVEFEKLLTQLGFKNAKIVELSEELQNLVRSLWAAGGTSSKQIWNQAIANVALKLMEAGLDETSARAIASIKHPKRFVDPEKKVKLLALSERNAKEVYDKHLPSVARTRAGLLPGELVFGDVSPVDIPVLRPDGSTAYARMISWMDAATNWMFNTLYLCPAGTGVCQEHVAQSFTSVSESSPFGMALRLYLDNGSEYKWEEMLRAWAELARLTGNQTHVELASALPESGKIIRSIPYRPRAKLIEGLFGNLRQYFGWHPAFQGGNRMAKRCANLGEAVKPIPFEDLQGFIATAMADYHATPQSGHLNGKSPQESLDIHLNNGWKPVRVDREVLLMAFAEQETRRVRGGIINKAGLEWYGDCLVGMDKKVEIRYPKHDPQCIFVFDDGKFLGVATPEHKYGLLEEAGAKEAGRRRKVLTQAIANMAGQVETIEIKNVIGSRGKLMGVNDTVKRAQDAAKSVELSDEAKEMLVAKRRALDEKARHALIEADKKANADKLKRWNVPKDPEDDYWKSKYED